MQDWIVPAVAGVLALVALGLAVALLRARSRTERALAQAQAETAALRDQVAALERRLDRPTPAPEASFVITDLGPRASAGEAEVEPAAARSSPRSSPTWCSARPWSRRRRSPTAYAGRSTRRCATGSGSR